ncbi:hypothetical protein NQ317_010260 [Molorchus minor]|uniref:DNA repair protein RAD51 homolog 3 n=1 Tax=Molorchus minor TaxID=1323400 RepID=A0ABQ9JDM8_9CUCU|nr:hypothetical protein NQ317_010260 [Molorchus minor]
MFPPTKTAFALYQEEILNGHILSYKESLDSILKGIIAPQTITEFAGDSGSGKTQTCLQLCISVQLPKCCGGLQGEALYISTNNNFSSQRVRELSKNFVEHYKSLDGKTKSVDFNEDFILKHIHYIKVKDCSELIACIHLLGNYLSGKDVKLVVIDSVSFPIRLLDTKIRKLVLSRLLLELRNLASLYQFAVILTNDLTTRVNEGKSYVTPSFGDSFYHLVNSRVMFSKRNTYFHAQIVKSTFYERKEAIFFI